MVDAGERLDDLGALGLGHDRPPRPLVRAGRGVAVHRDDEQVGLGLRALQVAEVADVEEVEHAVREGDGAPRRGRGGAQARGDRPG